MERNSYFFSIIVFQSRLKKRMSLRLLQEDNMLFHKTQSEDCEGQRISIQS